MTEAKTKKNPSTSVRMNPDYTASAVNLVNPPPVISGLKLMKDIMADIAMLEAKIADCVPVELKGALIVAQANLDGVIKNIKANIDAYGSYQDTEKGEYALKQRKESITYKPELVIETLESKLASLIIVNAVDTKALDGLVKGKLVSPEQARQCGEIKETYAYIIK